MPKSIVNYIIVTMFLVSIVCAYISVNKKKSIPSTVTLISQESYLEYIKEQEALIDDIAFTLFAEDRSTKLGMKYVLSVIMNRAKSNDLETMHRIIHKPKQFSCWVNGKRVAQKYNKADLEMYKYANSLVLKALSNNFKPITVATHYYNPKKANPKWANNVKEFTEVAVVQDHRFLLALNFR